MKSKEKNVQLNPDTGKRENTEISQTQWTKPSGLTVPSLTLLLDWYRAVGRDLPWRRSPSPYQVWISEIMLQQTRVEAVKDYYRRFLEMLPDIRSLAEAEEDTCLKLWEGLGYYSRIRNMHRAAIEVCEKYGGELPDTWDELRALPGIGDYTASAILSICFREPYPAVDGNLLRVWSRITAEEGEIDRAPVKKSCFTYFREMMNELPESTSPGMMNQALMDLGATVCLGNGTPHCNECPWAASCTAHAMGKEQEFPKKKEKKKRKIEKHTILIIRFRGGVLLSRRPETGLLANLFEFPNLDGKVGRKGALAYAEEQGFHILRIKPLPPAKHIFSHVEWHMEGFELFADEWKDFDVRKPEGRGLFLAEPDDLENQWAIPSAFVTYRDYAMGHPKEPAPEKE